MKSRPQPKKSSISRSSAPERTSVRTSATRAAFGRLEGLHAAESSERLFRGLVENNFDGVALTDGEGKVIYTSSSVERITGYSPAELLGKTILNFVYEDDRARVTGDLGELRAETGTVRQTKRRIVHKDGSIRWIMVTSKNLLNDPAVSGIVTNFWDITEEKRNEEIQDTLYRISEAAGTAASLEDLYKAVHAIISTIMPAENFYIALTDAHMLTISFPYFVDEVDVVAPKTANIGRGLTAYVLRSGKSLLCDLKKQEELETKGEIDLIGGASAIWLGVPLIVENKPIGVMTAQHYTDPRAFGEREKQILEYISSQVARVIERKRSEEQIRLLAHAIENVRDVIFRLSTDGIIVSLNTAFAELSGWTTAEWIGRSLTSIIHPDDLPKSVDMLRRATKGEIPPTHEIRIMKSTGDFFVAEVTSMPLLQEGEVIGILGDARDVTERKNLEEHLRQSQKMESVGILAGGIAHDFNNILTIIIAYASALQQPGVNAERLGSSLDAIKKTAYRGADLVQQILTFARKQEVSHESVHVNRMIEDLLKLLQETFPRTISYELDLDPAVGSVTGDQNQLHQALLNLCVNARDAMPDGGELTFSTAVVQGVDLLEQYPDAERVPYARLSVRDTGAGIAQLNRGHIFEPFFTTKERGRGTGLGLAVVYGIVKSHNGLIDFASEVNRGTTFNLYFPASSGIKVPTHAEPDAVEVVPGGSETIMIVEDEEMLLGLLRDLFVSKGYKVLTATDGVEAVELFTSRKNEIALVLSDMGLPRMSGLEAFQAMKVQKPNMKMILASGYLEPKLRSQLIAEGAKDFVQKPYEPTEILKKVREILSQR